MYKIRKLNNVGEYVYSNGTVMQSTTYNQGAYHRSYSVGWSTRKSKTWNSKTLLQNHLLKAAINGVSMTGWEIIEVIERPAGAIDEWFDAKMLANLLKNKG